MRRLVLPRLPLSTVPAGLVAVGLVTAVGCEEAPRADSCATVDARCLAEEPRPLDDVPFAVRGAFWVGHRSAVAGEGSDRQLEVDIWYPALNPDLAREDITYEIALKSSYIETELPTVVHGRALANAPLNAADGPYPVVVFSHGFSLNPEWYRTLVEHYASHGFIVLAPEHIESDWALVMEASIDRPIDVVQTLDFAEQLGGRGGAFAGQIDMAAVAVVGHSYGGFTALAMAGARFDFDGLRALCADVPPDSPKAFLCAPLVDAEAAMADRAGLAAVPEGLWPSLGDSRVTAIVPIAGDAYLFGGAGLSELTIPMMAIGGTADTGSPYDWGSQLAYESAASAYRALVGLEGAEHMIAATPCEDMPWLASLSVYEFLCVDPAWDRRRALDLIHHVSTAFLLDTSAGDATARAALAPEALQYADVQYATTL